MDKNQIRVLPARKLSGNISSDELKDLEKLLNDDPYLSYQVDIIVRLFDAKNTLRADKAEQAFKNHLHKIKTNKAFNDRLENNNRFMIKNYFKIAWRNITRHKVYTAINVFGLALGICACITIYLITKFDLSFDRFHPDGNRIYRIVGEIQNEKGNKDFLNIHAIRAAIANPVKSLRTE